MSGQPIERQAVWRGPCCTIGSQNKIVEPMRSAGSNAGHTEEASPNSTSSIASKKKTHASAGRTTNARRSDGAATNTSTCAQRRRAARWRHQALALVAHDADASTLQSLAPLRILVQAKDVQRAVVQPDFGRTARVAGVNFYGLDSSEKKARPEKSHAQDEVQRNGGSRQHGVRRQIPASSLRGSECLGPSSASRISSRVLGTCTSALCRSCGTARPHSLRCHAHAEAPAPSSCGAKSSTMMMSRTLAS